MTPAQIAATRRLLGLTSKELAQELGINPRTVRGWLQGEYSPSETAAKALRKLRAEHDAELEKLLGRHEKGTINISSGPRGRGWDLALATRLIDRQPDAKITWQGEQSNSPK